MYVNNKVKCELSVFRFYLTIKQIKLHALKDYNSVGNINNYVNRICFV